LVVVGFFAGGESFNILNETAKKFFGRSFMRT
jgi:hypothetical protein